jgi:hypothetical protein
MSRFPSSYARKQDRTSCPRCQGPTITGVIWLLLFAGWASVFMGVVYVRSGLSHNSLERVYIGMGFGVLGILVYFVELTR